MQCVSRTSSAPQSRLWDGRDALLDYTINYSVMRKFILNPGVFYVVSHSELFFSNTNDKMLFVGHFYS